MTEQDINFIVTFTQAMIGIMTILTVLLACLLICEVIVATSLRIGTRLGFLRNAGYRKVTSRNIPSYVIPTEPRRKK